MTPPALITVTLTTAKTSSGRRFYYLVAYRSTGGKRQRRKIRTGTTTKAVAEKQKRALELRIAAGFDPFAGDPDVFAFGAAVHDFLADGKSRHRRAGAVSSRRRELQGILIPARGPRSRQGVLPLGRVT